MKNKHTIIIQDINDNIRYVFNLINCETAEGLIFINHDTFVEAEEFHSLIKKEVATIPNSDEDFEIINNALSEIQEVIEINKKHYNG